MVDAARKYKVRHPGARDAARAADDRARRPLVRVQSGKLGEGTPSRGRGSSPGTRRTRVLEASEKKKNNPSPKASNHSLWPRPGVRLQVLKNRSTTDWHGFWDWARQIGNNAFTSSMSHESPRCDAPPETKDQVLVRRQ